MIDRAGRSTDKRRVPRVYLCDDQPEYRRLVRTVLSTDDRLHVVGEGGDRGFVIDDAVQAAPDVILLDVNMPGTNGLEALPHLRDAIPGAHVILLSSAMPYDYERDAMRAGAHGFIQKPRNIFDLPAMIREKLADADLEI